jgi:predicted acyltransferase (DUF342 family)
MLQVDGDASLNAKLLVADDASFNKSLYIKEMLQVDGDASLNAKLLVANDVSLNKSLYVKETVHIDGDASLNAKLLVADDVSLNKSLYVKEILHVNGDASLNAKLLVTNDVSLNKSLYVKEMLHVNGDASLNAKLLVTDDVSMNSKLYVEGDTHFNNNLFVNNDLTVGEVVTGDSFNVTDNGNNYIINNVASPTLTFTRGITYIFTGPFIGQNQLMIQETSGGANYAGRYGADKGLLDLNGQGTLIQFTVPMDAPDTLYYTSDENNSNYTGVINVLRSTGKRLFVLGDVSFTNNLYVQQDLIVDGNVSLKEYRNEYIVNTHISNYDLVVAEDLSVNRNLLVTGDVSLNSELVVSGDVSLNNRLFVSEDVSLNKDLYVGGNITGTLVTPNQANITTVGPLTSLVSIGDVSLNNQLYIGGDLSLSGHIRPSSNGTINMGSNSLKFNEIHGVTASFNSIGVDDELIIDGDLSLNNRLFVGSDASFNGKVFLGGDVSFSGNIIPTAGNTYSLGSADAPLSAVYVYQSSIHFMNDSQNDTTLSIDESEGTIDIDIRDSAGNQTDGARKKVLYAVNKKVGIGKRSRMANANLDLSGTLIASKDVSFNDRLFVQNDVSLNSNLYVGGDLSWNPSKIADNSIPGTAIIGFTGIIVMWSGAVANIPTGWVICDGTSNTPDLRSKFIIGFDSRDASFNIDSSGGSFLAQTDAQLPRKAFGLGTVNDNMEEDSLFNRVYYSLAYIMKT